MDFRLEDVEMIDLNNINWGFIAAAELLVAIVLFGMLLKVLGSRS